MKLTLIVRALALAAAVASLGVAAQSTLYRWVDKEGNVHFTDLPPPSDAKSATQKRFGSTADEQVLPFATQTAMKRNPVMLWVAPNCEPCTQGRTLLSNRGVPFSERDVQANVETQRAFKALSSDLNVPVLDVGGNLVKGFEEGQWGAALDAAGYPRERLYGQPPTKPTMANLPSAPKAPAEAAPPQ
jgi:glutaredoxin